MTDQEAARYSERIHRIIPHTQVEAAPVNAGVISRYYRQSAFFYRKFHSKAGAMHLPVKLNEEERHTEKLLFQARAAEDLIRQHQYTNVLELGCGMGFNTQHLATRNPEVQFTGMDLTPSSIRFAKKKAQNLPNAQFKVQDFDRLELEPSSFDLIFAIETLCHSANLTDLLQRLVPALKPNGRLVIFDGYVMGNQSLTPIQHQAYQLLCWGFALERFQALQEALALTKTPGLTLERNDNLSQQVLPNLYTFQQGAKRTLNRSFWLKLGRKTGLVPEALVRQLSAGLFSPYLMEQGHLGYFLLVFTKNG